MALHRLPILAKDRRYLMFRETANYCLPDSPGGSVGVTLSGSTSGVTYKLISNGHTLTSLSGTGSALTWSNPGAGAYTITASNSSCSNTMAGTATLTSSPIPKSYIASGGGSYCGGGTPLTVSLNNSDVGVNYQLAFQGANIGSPIAGIGSVINWTNLTPAASSAYTVTASRPACPLVLKSMSGSPSVTYLGQGPQVFNVGGTATFCPDSPGSVGVTLSGSTSGVTYKLISNGHTLTSLSGTGSALTWSNPGAGAYTITASNSSCQITMGGSATLTSSPIPNLYTVSGGGSYCVGSAPLTVSLSDSDIGVNYQLTFQGASIGSPIAGTGAAISWTNLTPTISGSYAVQASRPACPSVLTAMRGSPSANYFGQGPQVFNVGGTANICSNSNNGVLTLSGSQVGVTYSVNWTGVQTTPYAPQLQGSGSALAWYNLPLGSYTVNASNSSCSDTMNGSLQIMSQVSPPIMYSVGGGGDFCIDYGGAISLSGSDATATYQLFVNQTTPIGSILTGTGGRLTWTGLTQAGTYYIQAKNLGCQVWMNGSTAITFNETPASFNVSGGGTSCSNTNITLSGSQSESNVSTCKRFNLYRPTPIRYRSPTNMVIYSHQWNVWRGRIKWGLLPSNERQCFRCTFVPCRICCKWRWINSLFLSGRNYNLEWK